MLCRMSSLGTHERMGFGSLGSFLVTVNERRRRRYDEDSHPATTEWDRTQSVDGRFSVLGKERGLRDKDICNVLIRTIDTPLFRD